MFTAVTITVTIYRGNAEIKGTERSQQRPKDSSEMVPSSPCGSLLWLKAFPYTVLSHLLYMGATEAQEANVELGHEAIFSDARLGTLSTGLRV